MRNNLRTVAANLAAFFSPAAFEARARRREQLKLRRELAEIDETLAWARGRRAFAEERLRQLDQQETAELFARFQFQRIGRATRKPAAVVLDLEQREEVLRRVQQKWTLDSRRMSQTFYGYRVVPPTDSDLLTRGFELNIADVDETHGAGAAG